MLTHQPQVGLISSALLERRPGIAAKETILSDARDGAGRDAGSHVLQTMCINRVRCWDHSDGAQFDPPQLG